MNHRICAGAMALWSAGLAAQPNEFDCLIEPFQVVEIRSPVTGLIEQVHVRRGDPVIKGQPLVSLESSVERAQQAIARYRSQTQGAVRAAESRVEFGQRKLQRRRELAEGRFVSPQDRDEAEAELRVAEADLIVARENRELAALEHRQASDLLALRTLRSPLAGIVTDQGQFPGEMVEAGESRKPILKLAQIDPLKVDAILPLAMQGRVRIGSRAEVIPEAPVGGRHATTVRLVDKVMDAASGTFVVRMELPNPKGNLPAGLKCRVRFLPGDPVGSANGAAR